MVFGSGKRPARRGRPMLMWMVGAVLIGVWFLLRSADDDAGARGTSASAGQPVRVDTLGRPAPADPRIADFLSWSGEPAARRDSAAAARHVAEGIHRLAGAIAVLAVRDSAGGLTASGRIAALDSSAGRVLREPRATRQAALVRGAFVDASAMMQEMHRRRFPNAKNAVVEMRLAANEVRAAAPLSAQRRAVDQFFERTAIAVRRMSIAP